MKSTRWSEITPSEFAWERAALDYIKVRLPDGEPFRAWSNFEFIADDGSVPALVFEHDPDAERLDRFLERGSADGLDLATRLDLLRRLAEALKYAHERRIYHRGLHPQKVLVTAPDTERPKLEIFDRGAGHCKEVIEQEGWPPARMIPLPTVLQEDLPWLKQWHNEVDSDNNQRLGDFFETYLHSRLSNFGLTETQLRSWSPPESPRTRRTRRRNQ